MRAFSVRVFCWGTAALGAFALSVAAIDRPRSVAAAKPVSAPAAAHATIQSQTDDENPVVPAGLVKWHKSFDDAKVASKKSGKPVLLFHMMGQLDRQFC